MEQFLTKKIDPWPLIYLSLTIFLCSSQLAGVLVVGHKVKKELVDSFSCLEKASDYANKPKSVLYIISMRDNLHC